MIHLFCEGDSWGSKTIKAALLMSFVLLARQVNAASTCDTVEPIAIPIKNVTTDNVSIVKWGLGFEVGTPGQSICFSPSADWNNTSIWPMGPKSCDKVRDGECSWHRGGHVKPEESDSWAEIEGSRIPEFRNLEVREQGIIQSANDTLFLESDTTIQEFPLYTALNKANPPHNLLGLGRDSTFLKKLFEQGEIASRTWSLWWGWQGMEDSQKVEGSFVMGGYDKAKTRGESVTERIVESPRCPGGLVVNIQDIMLNHIGGNNTRVFGGGGSNQMSCIMPDIELITLPASIRRKLIRELPGDHLGQAKGIYTNAMLFRPKDVFAGNITITLTSKLSITIPNHQLFLPHVGINDDDEQILIDGNLTLQVSNGNADGFLKLGQSFLSSAYLHVDTQQGNFSLWNANATSDTDLVTVCEPGTSDSPSSGGNLSGGAIAGIVVGSVAGVAMIAALLFFLWRRRRLQKQPAPEIGVAAPAQFDGKEHQPSGPPKELDSGQGHELTAEMQGHEAPAMELPGDSTFAEMPGSNGGGEISPRSPR